MRIILDNKSGFCFGVQKAVDAAETALQANQGCTGVYCLGEIIHNQSVTRGLHAKGLQTVESLDSVPKSATVVLRAHGVGQAEYAKAQQKNLTVVDATCVFVKKIHKIVREYSQKEFLIVV
ncbi:MAG: 4-hydroxy-3-methylbut-2-enyl diphosphate reductase, partial [Firmicutes bacterium]|nr:4-hydroxy-3-methylbut-2-enyl diphosphate reductase [Bacillota bacterium]